jgi:hypothetical protein
MHVYCIRTRILPGTVQHFVLFGKVLQSYQGIRGPGGVRVYVKIF